MIGEQTFEGRRAAAETGHRLHEVGSGGTRSARRIAGDAVDHPGSADRAHRIAHEGSSWHCIGIGAPDDRQIAPDRADIDASERGGAGLVRVEFELARRGIVGCCRPFGTMRFARDQEIDDRIPLIPQRLDHAFCLVRRHLLPLEDYRLREPIRVNQVRVGDQSQDRQGARHRNPPTVFARADEVIE
jgi:hypothetical protein